MFKKINSLFGLILVPERIKIFMYFASGSISSNIGFPVRHPYIVSDSDFALIDAVVKTEHVCCVTTP